MRLRFRNIAKPKAGGYFEANKQFIAPLPVSPASDEVRGVIAEGAFIAAQWKVLAATYSVTPATDGKRLSRALRRLSLPDNPAAVQHVISLQDELAGLDAEIADAERELNVLLYRLYDLSPEDIRLVEAR